MKKLSLISFFLGLVVIIHGTQSVYAESFVLKKIAKVAQQFENMNPKYPKNEAEQAYLRKALKPIWDNLQDLGNVAKRNQAFKDINKFNRALLQRWRKVAEKDPHRKDLVSSPLLEYLYNIRYYLHEGGYNRIPGIMQKVDAAI